MIKIQNFVVRAVSPSRNFYHKVAAGEICRGLSRSRPGNLEGSQEEGGKVHEEDIFRGLSRNEARNVQGSQQQGGEEEICRGLSRRQEGGGCINL